MKADLNANQRKMILTTRKCAEIGWFVRLFPELPPNMCMPLQHARQTAGGICGSRAEKSSGSPITTSSVESTRRRTSWKIKAKCGALPDGLPPDKAGCSTEKYRHNAGLCAGLTARQAVPSLRQMRPAVDFEWTQYHQREKLQRPTRVQMLVRLW